MVYKGSKETDLYAYFLALANQLYGIKFMYYDSTEYITGRTGLPSNRIMLHREQEKQDPLLFEGKSYLELQDFIIEGGFSGIHLADQDTMSIVNDNLYPALILSCHNLLVCEEHIETLNSSNRHNHKLLKLYKVVSQTSYH